MGIWCDQSHTHTPAMGSVSCLCLMTYKCKRCVFKSSVSNPCICFIVVQFLFCTGWSPDWYTCCSRYELKYTRQQHHLTCAIKSGDLRLCDICPAPLKKKKPFTDCDSTGVYLVNACLNKEQYCLFCVFLCSDSAPERGKINPESKQDIKYFIGHHIFFSLCSGLRAQGD